MTLQNQRLEITDRVIGKLADGQVKLYLENEPIGEMTVNGGGQTYNLHAGFEQDGYRIFQNVSVPVSPDAKYVDCDSENGWC